MADSLFTSPLAERLAPGLLQRFLRYVRIDTQSRRDGDTSPSTPGQLELGRLLVAELQEVGLSDAALDEHGYVTATLASSSADGAEAPPTIGLIAHMDTSPDAPGAGVEPIVHERYDGGVLELPREGTRLDPERMPELSEKHGHDIVTSSGDTLLGADDKAGVAEIMAAVAYLVANPDVPRPRVRVAFTPDEEIGAGAELLDLARFGALYARRRTCSPAGTSTTPSVSGRRCRTWQPRRRRWCTLPGGGRRGPGRTVRAPAPAGDFPGEVPCPQ